MNKWLSKLAVGGLCLITIAIIGFFAIVAMNVDCDGFSCLGFFVILGPIFLLGLILMLIATIALISCYVYSLFKNVDDE